MKRMLVAVAAALMAACSGSAPEGGSSPVASQSALPSDPGWTGASRPMEVIAARQHLMEHIEELMLPIDLLEVGEKASPEVLQEHAGMIGAMLAAVPHLFPPTTNLFREEDMPPQTLALPAIWQNFEGFYQLAQASAAAAEAMTEAQGFEAQQQAGKALRASCDACHAAHLRPYKESGVLESDTEFDFDSVLGN